MLSILRGRGEDEEKIIIFAALLAQVAEMVDAHG